MFGPLVHATDPSRFYALDPEAACCFAYHGEPFVLAIGTVGFRDQGSTGKRLDLADATVPPSDWQTAWSETARARRRSSSHHHQGQAAAATR